MITKEKLNVYRWFNGDIDAWARSGSSSQKEAMKDEDWFMIERLIQDVVLMQKGLISDDFLKDVNKRLNDNCDNEETIIEIKKMAAE
jgi:hypothetical protein